MKVESQSRDQLISIQRPLNKESWDQRKLESDLGWSFPKDSLESTSWTFVEKSCNNRKWDWRRSSFFSFLSKTVEGNSRKTANHYGVHYANSYAYSNGAPSVYTSTGCCTNGGYNVQQPQLHEDYRPIYFYVAQPYTIPYTFAKRPKPATSSSLLRAAKPNNYRVKFSKRLSNADFSQKVKQGEFSRSLNQVHFAESQGQGYYMIFQFTQHRD